MESLDIKKDGEWSSSSTKVGSDDEIEVLVADGSFEKSQNIDKASNRCKSTKGRWLQPDDIRVGGMVYALDWDLKFPWKVARIKRIYNIFGKTMVDLKFELCKNDNRPIIETGTSTRSVNVKHIATFDLPGSRSMIVGRRVIARTSSKDDFFVGIVAEPPSAALNNNRVLIFFDDGLAAYCQLDDIRLVTSNGSITGKPWVQVHPDSQEFMKKYIEQYPNNPKATLRLWALITVEWCGYWWSARVIRIDCSLVEIEFLSSGLRQIVWRGSERLLVNYKRHKPDEADTIDQSKDTLGEYEGKIFHIQIPGGFQKKSPFKDHECSSECWSDFTDLRKKLRKVSPLVVPMYHGWNRKLHEMANGGKSVYYEAPCGKIFLNLTEIQGFITATNYQIGIDSFSFSLSVDCLAEFQVAQSYFQPGHYYREDVSDGKEWTPVSKVNTVNKEQPFPVKYAMQLVDEGNFVNEERDFLVCCDCTDNCEDEQKCACIRVTHEEHSKLFEGKIAPSVRGYKHRRLFGKVVSGIYECNKSCKCRPTTCVNRVAQNGLKWKLQVFCTSSKGYAVRTMQDIPKGSFICLYVGELLSNQQAFAIAEKYGDEYLADLDMLECCDQYKEGYEETVVEPNSSSSSTPEVPQKLLKKFEEDMKGVSRIRYYFGLTRDKIYVVDAKRIGNVGRYFNHSCNPNLITQHVFIDCHDVRFPLVALFAKRNLKCGTELTWDYNYITMSTERSLSCNCGAANCRRVLL